jgi:hypothetical protein
VTLRFFCLLACQLLLVFACTQARAADGVDITQAEIQLTDEGYRLNTRFAFELNHELQEAVQNGIKLAFTTEIEMTRPRWWWRDEKAVFSKRTISISYDVLTRQYNVSSGGTVPQSFPTLDEALSLIRRPARWLIAPKSALKLGETYEVSIRMFMDRDFLSKPLQVNAINDSSWRLASNRKTFTYKAGPSAG